MARVLIPGVLAGVAISLIANIVIGGIFYNLFNNTAVGTLAGTLTASVVGAILGVIAISTANRKDTAVVLRGAAAGAFIGVVGGFLGTVSTDELEGVGSNVALISVVVGAVAGAAGLRGTGMIFASAWVDEDEDMGTLGRVLDGAFAGVMTSVACALPVVLFYGGRIIIFPRLRPRVEYVLLVSTDELLLGGILGITAGILIGLVLSRKRVDGLLNGTLIGAVVGVVLALPAITVMTFTQLGGIWGGASHFGMLALAMVGGAALGASMPSTSLTGRYRSALVGVGIGFVFVLPFVIYAGFLAIYAGNPPDRSLWENFLSWNGSNGVRLVISAAIGAAIGLIADGLMKRMLGVSVGAAAVCIVGIAVALGVQGGYFLFILNIFLYRLGIELPRILFSEQFILALLRQLIIGVALGTLISVIGVSIARRLASISPDPDKIHP